MRTDEVGGEVPGWESLIATVAISTAPSPALMRMIVRDSLVVPTS